MAKRKILEKPVEEAYPSEDESINSEESFEIGSGEEYTSSEEGISMILYSITNGA